MELVVKPVEKSTVDTIVNLEHAARIAAKMSPDPKEWSYDGLYFEADDRVPAYCACGHPIKSVFVIERKRDGNQLNIGCVCIGSTVPYLMASGADGLAEALQKAQQKLEAEIKAKIKAKRDAEASNEVRSLTEDYEVLVEYVNEQRAKLGRAYKPYYIYKGIPTVLEAMTTPGRTAASIRSKYTSAWLNLAPYCASGYDDRWRDGIQKHIKFLSKVPVPKDPKLLKKLRETITKDVVSNRDMYTRSNIVNYKNMAEAGEKLLALLPE